MVANGYGWLWVGNWWLLVVASDYGWLQVAMGGYWVITGIYMGDFEWLLVVVGR